MCKIKNYNNAAQPIICEGCHFTIGKHFNDCIISLQGQVTVQISNQNSTNIQSEQYKYPIRTVQISNQNSTNIQSEQKSKE
jgi:hypothetical protein